MARPTIVHRDSPRLIHLDAQVERPSRSSSPGCDDSEHLCVCSKCVCMLCECDCKSSPRRKLPRDRTYPGPSVRGLRDVAGA
eukprot:768438-Hanusia_phi.AAC.7